MPGREFLKTLWHLRIILGKIRNSDHLCESGWERRLIGEHQEIANFSGPIGWLVSFAASILTGTAISNASILVLGVELVSFSGVDLEELFSYYAVEVDPPSCDGVSSTTMIVTGLVTIPVQ